MEKIDCIIRFLTPAFLGDAEQHGAWRSPPFKDLLRQWWRVAAAPDYGYDHVKLREAEGRLFGHAWLGYQENGREKSWASQSRVRMRLEQWEPGSLSNNNWPRRDFDQVVTTKDGKGRVDADLYLGFGPLIPPSKKQNISIKTLKNSPAVDITQTNKLSLWGGSLKEDELSILKNTLTLMHWFGTLGSRGRNGWGSLHLTNAKEQFPSMPLGDQPLVSGIMRDWALCMREEWPHAIGKDNYGPLIWFTEPLSDWKKVMSRLAVIKVDVRRTAKKFRFSGLGQIGGIHLLGYPAGKDWELKTFPKEARLAAQLRHKVVSDGNMLRGMIFHMPSSFPNALLSNLEQPQQKWVKEHEAEVWAAVHRTLDASSKLQKRGGGK